MEATTIDKYLCARGAGEIERMERIKLDCINIYPFPHSGT